MSACALSRLRFCSAVVVCRPATSSLLEPCFWICSTCRWMSASCCSMASSWLVPQPAAATMAAASAVRERRRVTTFMRSGQLSNIRTAGDREVRAAVLLPAVLAALAAERTLLAIAHGAQPLGADAEGRQVLLGGVGAPVAQRQVVVVGAALVGVAFDGEDEFRVRG